MSSSRKLAAIVFTDIVGYTGLMGVDEQKAFDLLRKNRQMQKPLIEKFNGTWIKEIGDGILASFSTVIEAVRCSMEIQKACNSINNLKLRVGIHLGDVVFEDNDVFGDGVNIAARLQALAPVGGILISESVNANIANKKDIKTKFVREDILKNVKEPIRIYEVITTLPDEFPGSMIKEQFEKLQEKSIAILPFVNMSNDSEQEYFSDGMAAEILNSLAPLKDLKIAGYTSSFQFKGKNIDLREVGEKLGINTVLEGSVRKYGNKLRVTAQLINVQNGFCLWSEKYDRNMDDIFVIQDEIAFAITEKLKITLLEEEKDIIQKNPTNNKEAYDLYLKGQFYWNRRGPGLQTALDYFEKAITLDPQFVLAYAGLANVYSELGFLALLPPHEAMLKARNAADKVVELEPLVEAYTCLAYVSAFYEWDWVKAKKQFQKAFAINPGYAQAHYQYSMYLSFVELDNERAIKEAKKAVELESLLSIPHSMLSATLLEAGQFEEALKESEIAVDLDSSSFLSFWFLGRSLIGLQRYNEAIDALQIAARLSNRHSWPLGAICWAYVLTGKSIEAQRILDELVNRSQTEFIPIGGIVSAACSLNQHDLAIHYLQKGLEQRDATLVAIRVWPSFSPLKTNLQFENIVSKMNFPEKK